MFCLIPQSTARILIGFPLPKIFASFVEIDALGRLLVPKDLTGFAQINKDIVLSSAVNIIEIWDKALYEKAIDDSVVDFANLAEEVMGDVKDDVDGIS